MDIPTDDRPDEPVAARRIPRWAIAALVGVVSTAGIATAIVADGGSDDQEAAADSSTTTTTHAADGTERADDDPSSGAEPSTTTTPEPPNPSDGVGPADDSGSPRPGGTDQGAPAPSATPRSTASTLPVPLVSPKTAFTVTLDPDQVVQVSSDTEPATGSGTAEITIDVAAGEICGDFTVADLDPTSGITLRRGESGGTGPPVITFALERPDPTDTGKAEPGVEQHLHGCGSATAAAITTITTYPTLFYVSAATAEAPQGAIRGQLS